MNQNPTIGSLRERVTVQRKSATRDAIGGIIETWATLATLWAKVEPKSAGEQYRRQQIQAAADWTVTIRYRTDVAPADRLRWRGHEFEIVGLINTDMRRQFLELSCRELQVSATVVAS